MQLTGPTLPPAAAHALHLPRLHRPPASGMPFHLGCAPDRHPAGRHPPPCQHAYASWRAAAAGRLAGLGAALGKAARTLACFVNTAGRSAVLQPGLPVNLLKLVMAVNNDPIVYCLSTDAGLAHAWSSQLVWFSLFCDQHAAASSPTFISLPRPPYLHPCPLQSLPFLHLYLAELQGLLPGPPPARPDHCPNSFVSSTGTAA